MDRREEQGVLIFEKKERQLFEFLSEIISQNIEDKNIILVVNELIQDSNLNEFQKILTLKNTHRKSIVIVGQTDIEEENQTIAIVPTIQEALDFIEMEEIERDLGF